MKITTHRIQREDLNQQIYDLLFEQIVNEDLAPGTRVVEAEIAKSLGVSRTPVREAIVALVSEGLLTNVPRRGVFVTRLDMKQVNDIFDVRIALEGYVARLATPNMSDQDIERLVELQDRGERMMNENVSAAAEADDALHGLLLERADNPRIADILAGLDAQIKRFRSQAGHNPTAVKEFIQERWAILDALRKRDADECERLMRIHVASAKKWIVAEFSQERSNDE